LTFLDAYGLVALVVDGPAADEVQALLRSGDARVVAINLAEAVDVATRVHGASGEALRSAIEPLLLSRSLVTAVSDEQQAWVAGDLRARHYDRRTQALSLADCFLLAHALADGAAIATADPAVANVARSEGVELVALPDSSGRRP
jgi:predicted nucleic acid-binding protein